MRLKLMKFLLAGLLSSLAGWAQAAATYTCTLGAPSSTYSATFSGTSNNPVAISVIVTCAKSGGGGRGTFPLASVAPNNGGNPSGSQNRGAFGGTFVNYDLYTDASCTTLWAGSGALSFTYTANGPQSRTSTVTFHACVPSPQAPSQLPPANTFTDSVTLSLTRILPAVLGAPNTQALAVSIIVPSICTISVPPGTLNFGTYAAFGPAVSANTTFGLQCNLDLTTGSMNIGASAGGVLGTNSLNYSLGVNTASTPQGSNSLIAPTATGFTQTFFINGVIPGGQAGTCATATCAGQTELRTLTVSP